MSATLAGAINRRRVVAAAAAEAAAAAAAAEAAAEAAAAAVAGEEERLDECELPRIGENPVNQDSTMFEAPVCSNGGKKSGGRRWGCERTGGEGARFGERGISGASKRERAKVKERMVVRKKGVHWTLKRKGLTGELKESDLVERPW